MLRVCMSSEAIRSFEIWICLRDCWLVYHVQCKIVGTRTLWPSVFVFQFIPNSVNSKREKKCLAFTVEAFFAMSSLIFVPSVNTFQLRFDMFMQPPLPPCQVSGDARSPQSILLLKSKYPSSMCVYIHASITHFFSLHHRFIMRWYIIYTI